MVHNSRNSSSGIIILFLMFVLFSFIQGEKERRITPAATHLSVISESNSSGQATINSVISVPGISFFLTSIHSAKFLRLRTKSTSEIIFDNLVTSSLKSPQFKFHSRNSNLVLFFLQKVPEQGKDDDIHLIA